MYQQVNGKKAAGKTPEMSPLHEEIVRYVTDVWKNVSREYDKSRQDAREGNRYDPLEKSCYDEIDSRISRASAGLRELVRTVLAESEFLNEANFGRRESSLGMAADPLSSNPLSGIANTGRCSSALL
ncbi:unnamed protein product [Darwinula stevensoni]|uniref:Uncharacterized protein n=1 Tax=Darwinula stevensoni TaxID=69355 RepID=A0A7R8XAK3_9CRUS|nr:unnamed protein product [Darwinula stevensoni]CAG0890737.1 unnamed protein product [Darwinula stevensoni]